MSSRSDRVTAAVADVVAASGSTWRVEVRPAGRRRQVVVTVDADLVDSDGLAELSHQVSEAPIPPTPWVRPTRWRCPPAVWALRSPSPGTGGATSGGWSSHLTDGHQVNGRIKAADEECATVDATEIPYAEGERAVVSRSTSGGE